MCEIGSQYDVLYFLFGFVDIGCDSIFDVILIVICHIRGHNCRLIKDYLI